MGDGNTKRKEGTLRDPVKAASVLELAPGVLNNLETEEDFESIDFTSESALSILNRTVAKVFTQSKLKNVGPLYGILLRKDKYNPSAVTELDIALSATGVGNVELHTYRVRIPELHFLLPVPQILDPQKQSPADKLIIDSYPVCQAYDAAAQNKPVKPGDIVRIEMGNKGALSRLYYLGPAESEKVNLIKYEDPVEEELMKRAKSYNGSGATGDSYLSKSQNIIKTNTSLPIATSGAGHGKVEIIKGPLAKEWLVNKFIQYQKAGKFKGKVYLDRFSWNGRLDDVDMKEGPGRSTVIYMPAACTPDQPLELIYWFHEGLDFKDNEWKNKLEPQLKAMVRQCRNFIFVEHEMLWSQEDARPGTGLKRLQTTFSDSVTWSDREWGVWSGPGGFPKPLSYKQPEYDNWLASQSGGALPKLHKEVLTILKNKFNVLPNKITELTLIGHGSGGAALGNLARRDLIGSGEYQIKPTKIVFSNATYSATSTNWYMDNDIFEVFKKIDNQTKLEVHVMWGPGNPSLPINSAAAFIGGLMRSFLFSTYGHSFSDVQTWYRVKVGQLTDLTSEEKEDSALTPQMRSFYNAGLKLISDNKNSFFRLEAPFENIIYKGWGNTTTIEGSKLTLKWLPPDEDADKKEITYTDGPASKSSFMGFDGEHILYNSPHNQGRQVVILKPTGTSPEIPYQLIYFFHGQYGSIKNSFTTDLKNSISNIVANQRQNVIIAMMNLGPKPDTGLVWDGSEGNNFNEFHSEVITKINGEDSWKHTKEYKNDEGKIIETKISPVQISFITLKAFDTGGSAARRAIENMTPQLKNKLQRIDFLEASYGYEDPIINDPAGNYGLKFGEDVEFMLVANPEFRKGEGDNSPWNRIKQYEGGKGPAGIKAIKSNKSHNKIPPFYFGLESNLFSPPLISASKTVSPTLEPQYSRQPKDGDPTDKNKQNHLPTTTGAGGYKETANAYIRGYGLGKNINIKTFRKTKIALYDKKTSSGKIKSYGSQTISKLYDEHIEQQLEISRKQHNATPSFEEESSYHIGVNNIIWKGKPFATKTPFKILRYDGTVPGFEKSIGKITGAAKYKEMSYAKISYKYWFDWDSPAASLRPVFTVTEGGKQFRSKEQITHITLHNAGGTDILDYRQRANMFSWKGNIVHFCIDEYGQIYQVCDAAAITQHCSGTPLYPLTNPNNSSIAIEFLKGTDTPWAKKRRSNVGFGVNSLNSVMKQLGYGAVKDWSKFGRTPLISAPSIIRHKSTSKDSYRKGWARRGYPYTTYFHNYRRHNKDFWANPTVHPAGTRAQHEAAYELIQFLENEIGCNIGSLAAVDARLDYKSMLNTGIQSHYQLQNDRIDGMSYMWWAWSQGKHKVADGGYIENPAPPDKKPPPEGGQ